MDGLRNLPPHLVGGTGRATCCGSLFALTAFALTIGNILAGILVPVQLFMGNVAPAAKDMIFYPNVSYSTRTDDTSAGFAKLNTLKAPSALRALGSIEGSDVTVRKRVYLDSIPPQGGQTAHLWVGRSYSYHVTGVDMGLQSDPKLTLKIKGSCQTDYTWLVDSTDKADVYRLFGGNNTFTVLHQADVNVPPMVNFFLNNQDILVQSSNISYALIIKVAGRYSHTPGQDPWYATEKARGDSSLPYQVQRGRPVLHCWEDRTWHLNSKDVEGSKLNTLTGLKLHKLWAGTIFPLEFSSHAWLAWVGLPGHPRSNQLFMLQLPIITWMQAHALFSMTSSVWCWPVGSAAGMSYATQRPTMRPASQTCSMGREAQWKLLLHNSSFKVEMSSPCPSGSSFLSRPLSYSFLSSRRP